MSTNVISSVALLGSLAEAKPSRWEPVGGALAFDERHRPPTIAPLWCPLRIFSITLHVPQPRTGERAVPALLRRNLHVGRAPTPYGTATVRRSFHRLQQARGGRGRVPPIGFPLASHLVGFLD